MHLASSGGKARDAADVLPCTGRGLPPPKGYPARRPAVLGRHAPGTPPSFLLPRVLRKVTLCRRLVDTRGSARRWAGRLLLGPRD